MANVVITSLSNALDQIDLGGADLSNATITAASATRITASLQGITVSLTGSFYYDSQGYPTEASSLSGLEMRYNGSLVASANGFNLPFATLGDANFDELLRAVLSGNDSYISAYNGNDYVETFGGDDRIQTGTGNDYIDGGSGFDTFIANGTLAEYDIRGGYGDLYLSGPNGETDILHQIERIEFQDRSINVNGGSAEHEAISFTSDAFSFLIFGGAGNDSLYGGNSRDTLIGGEDNDSLFGGSEADDLIGDGGNDRMFGNHGHDDLYGGTGNDTLKGGLGNDTLRGGDDADLLDGSDGRDRLLGGSGSDTLDGGGHNDRMAGEGGNDILGGGAGHDTLRGGSGQDSLTGGNGDDRLMGDGGKDVLLGHRGDDRLTGGKQADTFVFHKGHGNDTITDFTVGSDHIAIGRGASRLKQLEFSQQGDDVLIAFADVTILVEDTTVTQMQDADNFLF